MKAFHFRLEAVLSLRQQAEQAAQQRSAEAQRAVQNALAQLDAAEATLLAAQHQRLSSLGTGCQVMLLEQLRAYEIVLRERRALRARELAVAREQAEKAQVQLIKATQEREALEHLRDRQRRTHAYEAARGEQKALDEMSARKSLLACALQVESKSL